MENIGIQNMKTELGRLNPKVKFDVRDHSVSPVIIIFGSVPGDNLILPEGYYFNEKNGINNKHNTASGLYECFKYEFDVDHFADRKKSIFNRIFARSR